jgi:hypothetical protein
MGTACAISCGIIVAIVGVAVWWDEWVDVPMQWSALAIGMLLGGGTVLHALGVW